MWREPKPSRALTSTGNSSSAGTRSGSQLGGDGIPEPLEGLVGQVLVAHLLGHAGRREEQRRAEVVARGGEDHLVEIGERDDQVDVVLGDEPGQLGHIAGVVHAEDELVTVRVVEGGRERVGVRGNGRRAGPAERRDDVDALPRAGEEDRRHGERG